MVAKEMSEISAVCTSPLNQGLKAALNALPSNLIEGELHL